MKENDLHILKRQFNQASDAYHILGKRKGKNAKKPYVLAWKIRHGDKLIDCRTFKHLPKAMETFNNQANDDDIHSLHPSFNIDVQQKNVYDWEHDCLDMGNHKITRAQALDIIEMVSNDFNLETPKLTWKRKQDYYSECDTDDNEIIIGQHDLITVLHEMAHIIDVERSGDDVRPNHGPGFVWAAIELYNRYAGFDMSYLVTSAFQANIIGDLSADQISFSAKCALRQP